MTRPFAGASKLHYTFDPSKLSMDFINAVGSTPALSYHKSKTVSTIGLFPANKAPACVCSEPAVPFGQLKKNPPYALSHPPIPTYNTVDPRWECHVDV